MEVKTEGRYYGESEAATHRLFPTFPGSAIYLASDMVKALYSLRRQGNSGWLNRGQVPELPTRLNWGKAAEINLRIGISSSGGCVYTVYAIE